MGFYNDTENRAMQGRVLEILKSLDDLEIITSEKVDIELYEYLSQMYKIMSKLAQRMDILQGQNND